MDIKVGPLEGILEIPYPAKGLILFSHGSGSSRLSPRNTFVAKYLQKEGFATLLIDLLTPEEDVDPEARFDIDFLTKRLIDVIRWLQKEPKTAHLPVALFGASTGGASALKAAGQLPAVVRAVVSRGGRPDLALAILEDVKAPTLLLVGELDEPVIEMNKTAYQKLSCPKKMTIIPGATHLFEEPGCLEAVAKAASAWFTTHMESL